MDMVVNGLAEGKSFSEALRAVYVKRRVHLPMGADMLDASITSLRLSNRTMNAIRRAHVQTIRDLMDRVEDGYGLDKIKNFGEQSQRETKAALLDYAWNHMSQREKDDFLIDTVARNIDNVRI
jgi:DNA-directed RNA polymerase alpha subunit